MACNVFLAIIRGRQPNKVLLCNSFLWWNSNLFYVLSSGTKCSVRRVPNLFKGRGCSCDSLHPPLLRASSEAEASRAARLTAQLGKTAPNAFWIRPVPWNIAVQRSSLAAIDLTNLAEKVYISLWLFLEVGVLAMVWVGVINVSDRKGVNAWTFLFF